MSGGEVNPAGQFALQGQGQQGHEGQGEVAAQSQGQLVAHGAAGFAELPDKADAVPEEVNGPGKCTVYYKYPAQKGDLISFSFVDEDDPAQGFRLVWNMRRMGSQRVAYERKSKILPPDLKANLIVKDQSLEVKKKMYCVKMKKKTDFNITSYFMPDSPPL